jgi:replicative DNA helicase
MEQWAEHLARAGFSVLFFHLELSNEDMRDRMIQRHSGLPFADLREPLDREDVHARAVEALGKISEWPGNIRLVEAAGWTTARIVSAIQDAHAQGKGDVVFIDYMNLIRFSDTDANTIDLELNDIKNAASNLGIQIVIAQQPDKASRKERVMTLDSGKMTGGLHEKCNLGFALTRKRLTGDEDFKALGHYEQGALSPETTVRIDKATFGPSGEVKLIFWGERLSFADVSFSEEDPPTSDLYFD